MRNIKTPHIKVDAFPLVDDHFSGVGHYTLGIVKAFDDMAAEGKITYSLITPRTLGYRIGKYDLLNYKRVIESVIPYKVIRGFMKYKWRFPVDLFFGVGNYYFPSFLAWPTWFSKSTVVVHDVTYIAVPECVDEGNRDYLTRVVPFSLKNSKHIVAVSEFSKSEIKKYYSPKLDISVAHPSVDRRHFYRRSQEEIFKVRMRYDIFSEKYILSVGNVEPRKNYARLIEAYMSLPKTITDEYPLVIIGAGGWNNEVILDKMQEAKEKGYKIINPGRFVKDEHMPALYSGAHFFVFMPIYEGFGMSPVEAYACQTPVLASSVTSVPEAAGKAALYADPFNTSDIQKKLLDMFNILKKDKHHFDKAMKTHVESLNWRASAEITAAAATGLPVEYFRKDAK